MSQYESGNDIRQIVSCSEGGRALRLLKKREDTKVKAALAKEDIENESKKRKFARIDEAFGGSRADDLEEEFKKQTIGLVSLAEFQEKRQAIDDLIQGARQAEGQGRLRLQRKVQGSRLSFDDPDMDGDSDSDLSEGEEKLALAGGSASSSKKHFGKDPSAKTEFLYDQDRDVALQRRKADLIQEYNDEQVKQKKDKLEVIYSYWDGSGHRRSAQIEKGFTVGQFLLKAKTDLEKTDFPELRTVALDSLMYVKEDLILPHNTTFYDLIKDKARGKSGPLFHFDVHDDIRMANDCRIEKDESHAGKIVDRKWYERNKHIFPANRWEMYSKDKAWEQYTIHGAEVSGINQVMK